MLELTAFLLAVGPIAIMVTKLVDFVRNAFDKQGTWPKWSWNVLSFGLGVAYSLLTATNFINLVQGLNPGVTGKLTGTWGQVVTGLAIGGTASFWHEHLDATSQKASALAAEVPVSVST